MPIHYSPVYFLHYLLKREATQFFTSIAIRYLAIGMILIFEPIYIYFYFGKSLSLALLFFGIIHGLYGVLVVYGGKIMAKIGLKHSMLFSNFFFFGYYICLFFLPQSFILIPFAIILKAFGMTFFWPAFHTDFARFSEKDHRGMEVGKMNIAILAPVIISPIIGGWVLTVFNYPVLFVLVILVLLASAIPLFLSREVHEIYTDSYEKAWSRIFKKENRNTSLAFAFNGMEVAMNFYLWPLFMAILAIQYSVMGWITSISLMFSALFILYIGKITDSGNRFKLLNIGSFLTSIAWIIKYFVVTPFGVFLSHILYGICRSAAGIPFQTILYDKAALKGAEADEFIIYREIILNISRFFLFIALAIFFFFIPKINLAFLLAAVFSLGFMLLGSPPKFRLKLKMR